MKRWFGRSPASGGAGEAETSGTRSQTSLALNVLYHQLQPGQKYHVLDLGPACGPNVDFFSQFRAKVYIEDLYRTLSSFDFSLEEDDPRASRKIFEYLFPYWRNACFDVIMSWDVFNYLEEKEFHSLMQHLGGFCRKGTLLFALISTRKHIPEHPMTFRILDAQHLLYQSNSRILRACPRYQQTDLGRLMPDFRVSSSFLLRNGFKEYLFVRQ